MSQHDERRPALDLAWGVGLTPFNTSVSQGLFLRARTLLGADAVSQDTLRLATVQDHPTTHLLLRCQGWEPAFIPGSACPPIVEALLAQERADALALALLDQPTTPPSGGCGRL